MNSLKAFQLVLGFSISILMFVPTESEARLRRRHPSSITTTTTTMTTTTTTTTTMPAPAEVPVVTSPNPVVSGGGNAGPSMTSFQQSGGVILKSGDVITGLHISNLNGPCILGNNVSNVRIYNNQIGPCAQNENGIGVSLEGASDVMIDHNSFDDIASALYAASSTNNIVFDHNYAARIRGPIPRGQMVQLNNVVGSGIKITCNVSDQTSPAYTNNGMFSGPEDHINIYYSKGTTSSPIEIAFNKIRGGGPSTSGGGILPSDGTSEYVVVHDNNLVRPGQYGVAAAGGQYIKMMNNKIFSGTAFAWSNIGMFAWNQYSGPCTNIEMSGNRVYYMHKDGYLNPYWNPGNCSPLIETGNIWNDQSLSESIWDEVFDACN